MKFPGFTSVTRWVIVVFGCAVLATAQPMNTPPAPTTTPTVTPVPTGASASNQIIYPQGSSTAANTAVTKSEDGRGYLLVVAILLAGASGWVMLQRRKGMPILNREARKLQIEETRPLGNRQYLVVASYEDRKFLLGVTAGQIQLLSDLNKPEQKP
ncbi:MAG TPA: flagellar biosynthetic protein FliO [Opitutaceae bacterium]